MKQEMPKKGVLTVDAPEMQEQEEQKEKAKREKEREELDSIFPAAQPIAGRTGPPVSATAFYISRRTHQRREREEDEAKRSPRRRSS